MKKILFATAFAIFANTQAFAIFGVGAHYVTNLGTLEGKTEPIDLGALPGIAEINLKREEASVLQGLGFKVWLDVLPFIDIEATFNMSATRYNTSLELVTVQAAGVGGKKTEVPLEYKPEAPYNMLFDRASPIFGLFSGDVSITYPFDVLPIIRPYVGLGISYMASLPVVDRKFAEDINKNNALTDILQNPDDPEFSSKITKAFSDAISNADYKTGIGGHAIVGVRAKPPVIPFAVYANTKYYFGGNIDKKFTQGIVFEIGGGFAL